MLLMGALSLLLVFRTEASFSRMVKARRVRPQAPSVHRSTHGLGVCAVGCKSAISRQWCC